MKRHERSDENPTPHRRGTGRVGGAVVSPTAPATGAPSLAPSLPAPATPEALYLLVSLRGCLREALELAAGLR
jgi:hypothetical protein